MPSKFQCIYSVQSDSQISFSNMPVMPLAVWPHTGMFLEVVWKLQFGINAGLSHRHHTSFPSFFLLLLFKVIQSDCHQMLISTFSDQFLFVFYFIYKIGTDFK